MNHSDARPRAFITRLLLHTTAVAAALFLGAGARAQASDVIHYVLTPESRITYACHTCDPPVIQTEILSGSFDITAMPVPSAYAVEAVTGIRWHSQSFDIRGAGFEQRLGTNLMAMVVDSHINDNTALLTTGKRQRSSPAEIRLVLITPDKGDTSYTVSIVALPTAEAATTSAPDADGDGVADADDNCVAAANSDQADSDRDGVGDACDACPETSVSSPVLGDGCAVYQHCACDGPDEGSEWRSQREYLQCVTQVLKVLKQRGRISRRESLQMMQDAVRSGCGQRVVAMR